MFQYLSGEIYCFAIEAQLFRDDMLHLTQESGDIFVESILCASEAFFGSATRIEVEDVTEMEVDQTQAQAQAGTSSSSSGTNPKVIQTGDLDKGSKREMISELEKRVKTIEEKCLADNLVFARNREDLDFISNEKKEDRIIITGLTNRIPMPIDEGERRIWLDNMVAETLCKIDPERRGQILFIKPG